MFYFIEATGRAIEAPPDSEGRVSPLNRRYRPTPRQLEFRRKSSKTVIEFLDST